MSDTPIYDQLTELRKLAHRNGAYQLKHEILKWVDAEIKAGNLKKTADIEKIIKGIEGIKTWENTSQNENQSTGNGTSTTSKTSGTRSKNPRSSASLKKPVSKSKPSSTKSKSSEKLD